MSKFTFKMSPFCMSLLLASVACDAEAPEDRHSNVAEEPADNDEASDESGETSGDGCDNSDQLPSDQPLGLGQTCDLGEFEQDARVVTLATAAAELRAQIPVVSELPDECAPGATPPEGSDSIHHAGLSTVSGLEEEARTLEANAWVSADVLDLHVKRLELVRRSFERDIAAASCDDGALWAVECTKILTDQWVCIPTTDEDLQDLKAAEDCDCPIHWKGQCLCDKDHSTD